MIRILQYKELSLITDTAMGVPTISIQAASLLEGGGFLRSKKTEGVIPNYELRITNYSAAHGAALQFIFIRISVFHSEAISYQQDIS